MRREFEARRDLVCARLAALPGVRSFVPDGAFYAFFDVSAHFGRAPGGRRVADSAGFCQPALDAAQNVPRARAQTDHAMLHVLAAACKPLGAMGAKVYGTSRKGAQFVVTLFDGKTGGLLALIQADYLGQVRTGAASGVATRYMARPDATTVGIYGSGKQARTQVQAVCKVRKISRVHVYSPSEEHRHRFAEEMSRLCETEVVAVAHPELAARNMDIVITATASREPVLHASWIA